MLTAHKIYEVILARAEKQLTTTSEAKKIIEAGLGDELRSLIEQIAGNSANPLENLFLGELESRR